MSNLDLQLAMLHASLDRSEQEIQRLKNWRDDRWESDGIGDGVAWPGIVFIHGKPFRDGALAPNEISGSDGAITDNSTDGAKTWIRVCVDPIAPEVTYEDAPIFISGRFPPDTEYYEKSKTAGAIHVTRFG